MDKSVYMKWILILLLLLPGVVRAQQVNEFPDDSEPLHARVEKYDAVMRGNHWNEGVMMPHVIFPPAGTERPMVGNQEDAADETSQYLSAYAFKYAVTKDPKDRDIADQLMDGLLKLEKVTGTPGWVARSLNRTDEPIWHEQVFFFPMEWHESTSMPGYRWEGDLSSDKFVNLCCAMSIYFDLCADEEHKKMAADLIDRFVGRVVDNNFKMVDVDGKMTLWGNFCPDLPHEKLNSLEILAGLRVAHHLTGNERYLEACQMLIEKHHYDDEAILAKVLWPEEWKTPWDDHLAAKSLYTLMQYETDPSLRQKYRMSLNRHWFDWKTRKFDDAGNLYLVLLYQILTKEPVVNEDVVDGIKHMKGCNRRHETYEILSMDGLQVIDKKQGEAEGSATTMILTYWMGRYWGIIPPEW